MFVTLTLNPAVDVSVETTAPLQWNTILHVRQEVETPGGKGINVAKLLAVNKRPVTVAALVGRDRLTFFSDYLEHAGIQSRLFAVDAPTRVNWMVCDSRGRELKINRPGFVQPPLPFERFMEFARSLVQPGDVALLCGSLPPGWPADGYARLIRLFHDTGCTVGLDTSGTPLQQALAEKPDLLKPNRRELAEALGKSLHTERSLLRALISLMPLHEAIVVSDGARGAWFASKGQLLFAPSPPVERRDSTGAGDALFGQFCADYFPERCLTPTIAARAVAAGAAAVEQLGTPLPNRDRILTLASQVSASSCLLPRS